MHVSTTGAVMFDYCGADLSRRRPGEGDDVEGTGGAIDRASVSYSTSPCVSVQRDAQ